MDLGIATVIAAVAGAIGALIGSTVNFILTSRAADSERVRTYELDALRRAESRAIDLGQRIMDVTVLPRPMAAIRDLHTLLDFVASEPTVIGADDAINELVEIANAAIYTQSLPRFLRHYLMADYSAEKATLDRLAPVLTTIIVAIRDRRREILGAPNPWRVPKRRRWWRRPR